MKRSTLEAVVGIIIILALVIGALAIGGDSEWGGADGGAEDMIAETGYEPWFESPLWAPPSGEVESLLFAIQAAIGTGVACLIFGYWLGQSKRKDEKEA
ncbi:MAG: energy-coupling factor ABC transporter substrate-binding protein [Methanomicrobium sp.]|nr:energy-coupling factor ABC transporter substrate-binding protein [Methanomicrobium sp.]